MKPRTEIFFGLWITTLCLANDPAPYSSQFARLDRIFALTTTRSQTGVAALELLELVAQGRTSAIRPGTETQVGLAPGELQQGWFTVPSVRVHALQRIGQSQLPEALDFLRTLGRGDLGEDASQMVWPAAQIA